MIRMVHLVTPARSVAARRPEECLTSGKGRAVEQQTEISGRHGEESRWLSFDDWICGGALVAVWWC